MKKPAKIVVGTWCIANCRVPCDHVPTRSWAYFQARDLMLAVIESLKQEERT